MRQALLIIGIIAGILFIIISIIRMIMIIFLNYTINKYKKLLEYLKRNDLGRKEDIYVPTSADHEDELMRNKNLEKKKAYEEIYVNVQKIGNKGQSIEDLEKIFSEKEIVGIVKNVGYWTSLVMGDKVTNMMQYADELKKQNSNGYWQNKQFDKGNSRGAKGRGL